MRVVGTFSSSGDAELVGSYFVEIIGVSRGGGTEARNRRQCDGHP